MISTGTRLGTYEITNHIGSGGMGEVYQAHDSKLGRDVAIKVLPEQFARDPERLARFQREAKLLASLNHPNIATIHAVEESNGTHYLVMELVPGETLRERVAGGRPVPVEEALTIAKQIAEALEAAHNSEKGIIHRDLKPANVKVTPEGRVKVLDFGLAKAFATDAANEDPSNSPTLSMNPTMHGVIMGTPAYMSPEQARGKSVDKRTDIWAFGCVLYESLTSKQAFRGETQPDTIAAVLEREPDWQVLPAATPAQISTLLRRCLNKDIQHRLRDIGDARMEIAETLASTPSTTKSTSARSTTIVIERGRLWQTVVAACLALLFVVASLVWWWSGHLATTRPDVVEHELTANTSGNPVYAAAISPEGRYLAFADYDGVFLRVLETGETHKVPLPEGLCFRCSSLSWFRDGTNLAVVGPSETGQPALWLISIFGGAPRKLRDNVIRASVSPDGTHIGFIGRSESEIWVMRANGEDATKLADAGTGGRFIELQWSPDGRRLAFLKTQPQGAVIELADVSSGVSTALLSDSRIRTFCWTPDGRMILSRNEAQPNERDSNLWELPIDNRVGRLSGEPTRITNWPGFSFWDLTTTSDAKRLAFVKRSAHMTVFVAALTGDGREISDPRRLTLNEQNNFPSAWLPDNRAVLFLSDRDGNWSISKQSAEQRTPEDFVTDTEELGAPRLSPDKSWLLYWARSKSGEGSASAPLWRLLRMPSAGGASETALESTPGADFRCPLKVNASCILGETSPDRKQILFTAFDPTRGRQAEVAKFNIVPTRQPLWDISPDGSVLAVADLDERSNQVLILDLAKRISGDLVVEGATELSGLAWSTNGDGFFITCLSSVGSALLKLTLDGKEHKLWTTTEAMAAPVPSSDGKKLAFAVSIQSSNAWTIENF